MLGNFEVTIKPAPAAAGSTAATRPFATAVSGVATAAAPVTTVTLPDNAAIPEIGCVVSWISDTDCYVRVGDANVGSATTSDWFLPAGVEVDWWHNGKTQTHFSVLQKTAGGTIKRRRSSI